MTFTAYVAGTFNVLTGGHEKLLLAAKDYSWINRTKSHRFLQVYITSDAFAKAHKTVPVRPFDRRAADIRRFLTRVCGMDEGQFSIDELPDVLPATDATDILVCSTETEADARRAIEGTDCKLVVVKRGEDEPSASELIRDAMARKRILYL